MRNLKTLMNGICLLLILAACNQSDWYDTSDEAIENGLQEEGIGESPTVSVEEYEGETIVLYAQGNFLGAASITESERGYSWYKSAPDHGIEVTGDLPYTTGSFEVETESGVQISILYGEIFDPTIQVNDVASREGLDELTLLGDSQLFYAVLE